MPALAGALATPGPLALVSQSGALTSSILDWASQNAVGFSTVVSLGPNTSVDIAQVLDFLASDPQTHSIVVYLEGISSARRFMSALRAAANAKPVVVLKAGRKKAGNQAAQTHSGAIVGSDDVFDAALRRAGAVRVRSFVALFSAAKCLASRYRPVGKRLAIVTNGGGPGVLAADWISEINLQLGQLSPRMRRPLTARLAVPGLAVRPDRSVRRRRAGALSRSPGGRQQGKPDRRRAGHPLAQSRLRCRSGGAGAGRFQAAHEQAAADLLDGRRLGGRGARHPERRHDPDLPHARRPRWVRLATSPRSTRTSSCCSRRRRRCRRWPSPTSKARAC